MTDAPPCQAYLVITPDTAPEALSVLLDALEAACLLIRGGGLDADALRDRIEALRPLAQARGVAVVLENEAALAAKLGCDGVHLSDPAATKSARQALGPDAIVGVACGDSRHDAMVAGENGADYVAFGALDPPQAADAELIAWWQASMTLPCIALGAESAEEAGTLVRAGADFLALGPELWNRETWTAAIARPASSC